MTIKICSFHNSIPFLVFSGLMLLQAGSVLAEEMSQRPATTADILLYMTSLKDLPQYCQCRLAETKFRETFTSRGKEEWPVEFDDLRKKWIRIIGKNNWTHVHHYCFGVMSLKEAFRMTGGSEERELRKIALLKRALQEFKYIENSTTDSSFPLWAQLYMYEFQIYSRLGQPAMAQKAFLRALEVQRKQKSP